MITERIKELIERRRRQLLVHSYIYYELGDNLVTDDQWSTWAKELYDLQIKYPKISEKADLYEEFKDFDYSSGFNLPFRTPWVANKANQLMDYTRD